MKTNKKFKILISFISGMISLVPTFCFADTIRPDPDLAFNFFDFASKKVGEPVMLGGDPMDILFLFVRDVINPCFDFISGLISDFLDLISEYPLLLISCVLVFLVSALGLIFKFIKRV